MSIINDALKKAGKDKEFFSFSNRGSRSTSQNLGVPLEVKKPHFNWGPIFVLLVLFLITGPIIAPIFSTPFRHSGLAGRSSLSSRAPLSNSPETIVAVGAQIASAPTRETATNRKAQFGIEEASLTPSFTQKTLQTPYLNLSGIMVSAESAYCIINDKIVKTGDSIQEATLVKVTPTKAVLEYEGQQIVLSVSQ